jgi:hypothetical protein
MLRIPNKWLWELNDGIPKDPHQWPGVFLISWPERIDRGRKDGKITAKLVYFQKMKGFGDFVRWGSVFYHVVLFWAERNGKAQDCPMSFFIGINDDGVVRPLTMVTEHSQTIRHKHRHYGEAPYTRVHHRVMALPQNLVTIATDHNTTPTNWADTVLCETLNAWYAAQASGSVQVHIRRGAEVCWLAIPPERTKSFFRDRQMQINDKGSRRRIFHYVEAHERQLPDGRMIEVSAHYRGARRFAWKDYQVNIAVSGHHHQPLHTFTAPGSEEAFVPAWQKGYDSKQTGKLLRRVVWQSDARVRKGKSVPTHVPSTQDLEAP